MDVIDILLIVAGVLALIVGLLDMSVGLYAIGITNGVCAACCLFIAYKNLKNKD